MIDHVVYERRASKCATMDHLQQQKLQKNSDPTPHSPRFVPHPNPKIVGTPLLCPVLKMKNLHLCICVSCHLCVYCWVYIMTIAEMYG